MFDAVQVRPADKFFHQLVDALLDERRRPNDPVVGGRIVYDVRRRRALERDPPVTERHLPEFAVGAAEPGGPRLAADARRGPPRAVIPVPVDVTHPAAAALI